MVVPPKVPHLRGQEATVSAAGERRPGEHYTVVPPKVPQPRGRGATGGLPFAIWLLADQLYHRRTSLWPIGYRHWHLQSQRHRKQAAQQYIREEEDPDPASTTR